MIISDSLVTVRVIQQKGTNYLYNELSEKFYIKMRTNLIQLISERNVDAIWVNSRNTNAIHLEVDNTCRTVLSNYLTRGL